MVKRITLLVAVVALFSACGVMGGAKVDTITVTAETAATVADRAVRTNAQYKQFCAAGAIAPDKCKGWAEFYPKFQQEYAAFYLAYKSSIAVGNIESAQQAAARLELLSDQLLLYYLVTGGGK